MIVRKTKLIQVIQKHCRKCISGYGRDVEKCIGSVNCRVHLFRNGGNFSKRELKKGIYYHCYVCMSGKIDDCKSSMCAFFNYKDLYKMDLEKDRLKKREKLKNNAAKIEGNSKLPTPVKIV